MLVNRLLSGPFTKHRESFQKFRETGNLKHIYKSELDKALFAHDAAYFDSKDLAKKAISDKIDMAYKIAINRKCDYHQRELARMVYKFFDKKAGSRASKNEQLAQGVHKLVFKKFKRKKVHSRFKDNICVADLAELGSLSSKNCGIKYLLCVT